MSLLCKIFGHKFNEEHLIEQNLFGKNYHGPQKQLIERQTEFKHCTRCQTPNKNYNENIMYYENGKPVYKQELPKE